MYHCSPVADLTPEITVSRSLCLADDMDSAALYLRGDGDHHLYSASWGRSASIATESDLHEICRHIGVTIHEGLEYEATKKEKVRQAIVDAGFEGVRYGDTCEGCDYECVEFFIEPQGFRWSLLDTVEA